MPQPDVLHFTPAIQTADPVGSLDIDKREIPEASSIGTTTTDPQTFLQPHVPRLASGSGYSIALDLDDPAAEETGFGTLVLSHGGRSKYLGPTAASEWLKDSETQEIPDTPSISRATSPKLQPGSGTLPTIPPQTLSPICFPFNNVSAYVSMATLLSKLPAKEEAIVLIDSYYRYCAWHHDVVPRPGLQKIFDRLYPPTPHVDDLVHPVSPQELALVFILLAQGTLYNLEMPNNDPSAEGWLNLSERALVKGNFFANNTIPAVQTLHLMAHYHLHMDKGRRGDYAWPLWGLTMRLIQAMGMHRDGARWNLPQEVVEERRKVFWECNAADTFQAHCFSRPCTINPEHCDTAFPTIPLSPSGEKGYTILRYELSQLSGEILNMAMKVRRPPYSTVTDLHQRLCTFEQNLPFSLRCRAAMLATPSRFPDSITAIESSPEPSRRSMALSFQQTSLALNISETIIFLHRPYFARVLYSDTQDRVRSAYATSYLAVIERCGVIISMVADIHSRFPTVSTRQWHLWYHVFNSAVCVGTLALRDPHNPLTGFAMTQIEAAIRLMTMLIQSGASSPRPVKNLQWLLQLRNRALAKLDATKGARMGDDTEDQDDPESVEVLGWRTRLVERASQNKQTTKTIESPSAAQAAEALMNSLSSSFGYQGSQSDAPTNEFSSSTQAMTDSLLHDFWDPMILQDVFNNTNNQTPTIDSSTTNWWEALGDNPNTFQPR
uniref:Xylanolytic transcriptional activator regulatory domain-containing protein n=1 Tax=Kwoniella bestiolae CBS 10118 TaxID=1296100 RepID=A0A1B9GH17_9TREE|nr:hypothetical protein I302_01815 [Kwoniella bestiolae CBS 10118]OCF30296.1 hypothetical protein I302_01815 [Kwoniella bestiolae CBS 10118]